jgi:hypothetical protein
VARKQYRRLNDIFSHARVVLVQIIYYDSSHVFRYYMYDPAVMYIFIQSKFFIIVNFNVSSTKFNAHAKYSR